MHSTKSVTTNKSNGHYMTVENGYQPPLTAAHIPASKSPHILMPNAYQQKESEGRYTLVPTNTVIPSKTSTTVKEVDIKGMTWNKKSSESVSFIPQNGENCGHDLSLKKDTRTKCDKCALYSAFVGLTFVLSAIIW